MYSVRITGESTVEIGDGSGSTKKFHGMNSALKYLSDNGVIEFHNDYLDGFALHVDTEEELLRQFYNEAYWSDDGFNGRTRAMDWMETFHERNNDQAVIDFLTKVAMKHYDNTHTVEICTLSFFCIDHDDPSNNFDEFFKLFQNEKRPEILENLENICDNLRSEKAIEYLKMLKESAKGIVWLERNIGHSIKEIEGEVLQHGE